jgi:hypothetical protein
MKKHIVPVEVLELQDGDYHLFISAYVGRKKIRLLIDSGASKTILSKAYCKESFRIGNFKIKNFVCGVLDISHVSEIYSQLQLPPFDGVLGCDILVSYAVTLDLKRKLLIIPN